jgi:single-strand DNA-binding protein
LHPDHFGIGLAYAYYKGRKDSIMPSMNRVYLMGNITRDPECRQTPSGISVADLRLAVSEKYKNRSGENVETVCFADIVVWGRQAETCAQYLSKGSPILVEGRLQFDEWEKDGQKHSKLRVRADRVQFMGKPENRESNGVNATKPIVAPADLPPVDDLDDTPF